MTGPSPIRHDRTTAGPKCETDARIRILEGYCKHYFYRTYKLPVNTTTINVNLIVLSQVRENRVESYMIYQGKPQKREFFSGLATKRGWGVKAGPPF